MKKRSLPFLLFLSGVGRLLLGATLASAAIVWAQPSEPRNTLVTGIGGVFFKARDPEKLRAWYREHLGIDAGAQGVNFFWREADRGARFGRTVWSVFPNDANYFGANGQSLTINRPVVSAVEAPVGTDKQAVQWMKVVTTGLGVMLTAVARPQGTGPFPAVIILHGSHGFAREYVQLAESLARGGLLAVAACWFSGGGGEGSPFVTPIACPDAPAMPLASSPVAQQTVDALVQAVRTFRDARPDRVALFGHSRGGGAALNYILTATDLRAAVLDSTGYPRELTDRARDVHVPILILHGTADSPADGGSAVTSVKMARHFEEALRRARKSVEAKYYEGGSHNGIFSSPTQYDDEVQRTVTFLRRRLFN